MTLITYFLISFALSALSSLPVGMITLNVMLRAIEAGKKAGFMMAFGATFPEFIYTYIALYGFDFFNGNIRANRYIQIIACITFFLLAIYFLVKKQETKSLDRNKKEDYFDFGRGFMIAAMNVLIIPFWIFIAIWLQTYDYTFITQSELLVFSLGSTLGALAIFLLYAELGHFILHRVGTIIRYTNKIIGFAFIILGVYQLNQIMG